MIYQNLELCVDELLGLIQPRPIRKRAKRATNLRASPTRDGLEIAQSARDTFSRALKNE
jgi:hypothetical protein